jgi:hypothetical protein
LIGEIVQLLFIFIIRPIAILIGSFSLFIRDSRLGVVGRKVEIEPASKGRNDQVSGARIRRKMPTYADFRGWVISTIAGWFVVTADT